MVHTLPDNSGEVDQIFGEFLLLWNFLFNSLYQIEVFWQTYTCNSIQTKSSMYTSYYLYQKYMID